MTLFSTGATIHCIIITTVTGIQSGETIVAILRERRGGKRGRGRGREREGEREGGKREGGEREKGREEREGEREVTLAWLGSCL